MAELSGSSTPSSERLGKFGSVSRVKRPAIGGEAYGEVAHLELAYGGHNGVQWRDETMLKIRELLQ